MYWVTNTTKKSKNQRNYLPYKSQTWNTGLYNEPSKEGFWGLNSVEMVYSILMDNQTEP